MSEEAIAFIAELFGDPITQAPIYFSSLANERDGSGEVRLATRDQEQVTAFIRKHDRPGRGLFVCAGTVNGKRNKDTIAESVGLYTDIDFKDHPGVPAADIRAKVDHAKLKPSIIVNTGHGLHVWYLFHAGLDAQVHRERLETALRALADHFGGDTQVAEISRLMRLPGTHNTKFDSWVPVTAEITHGNRYSLNDLEGWLLTNTRPLLQRRAVDGPPGPPGGAPTNTEATNPFLVAAAAQGYKPPIDVEALLTGMAPGNIHATQLSVSAAMLERGATPEEVVKSLLLTTRRAAASIGAKWNWKKEERDLHKMCLTWLEKHPKDGQPDRKKATNSNSSAGTENVVDLGEARTRAQAKPKPAPKQDKTPKHIILGQGVLTTLAERGELLLFTDKGPYRYIDNLWHLEGDDKAFTTWLNVEIEKGIATLEANGIVFKSARNLITEAREWIRRRPELHKRDIAFDAHGLVPCRSGFIDPRTGVVQPPAPEFYATWRVECEYDPAATCELFLRMLRDVFVDRTPEELQKTIDILLELLGAGLIDVKPKALAQALVLWGAQNTGKSEIVDTLAGLFGQKRNGTPLSLIDKNAHGTVPFVHRRPWVLHEAFEQNTWLPSSTVKSLISGNEITINLKGGLIFPHSFRAPIFWSSNHQPGFHEETGAMRERMIILPCKQTFETGEAATGIARLAQDAGYTRPHELVLATELPGLLAFAVTSLQRCLARGHFIKPAACLEADREIALDSNIVAGFIEDCFDYTSSIMVSAPDFGVAHAVWWAGQRGEDGRTPSNIRIGKAIRALGDPLIAQGPDLSDGSRRHYAGIAFNAHGLELHKRGLKAAAFERKAASASALDEVVNKPIPGSWADKPAILAMRKAHQKWSDKSKRNPSPVSQNPDKSGSPVNHSSATQVSGKIGKPRF